MRIRTKLDLNGNYQNIDAGALVSAKNVKLNNSYSLISDKGFTRRCEDLLEDYVIVGAIPGLDGKVYLFTDNSRIYEYDEITKEAKRINANWNYDEDNNPEISGCVTSNNAGERILTVAQYSKNGNIPLQHINLDERFVDVASDTLYCQAPHVPIANIILSDTYARVIPNGTYVFYIRYKIREDVYTPWMVASNPIFAGVNNVISTIQGGLKYINLHKDSARSFILNLSFINSAEDYTINYYKQFQLGFVITHEDSTVARTWKSFNINPSQSVYEIYFDYDEVKETTVDNITAPIYELYNVRNVVPFKNNLYISNYKETDFNPSDLSTLSNNIKLNVVVNTPATTSTAPVLRGQRLVFNNNLGYYDKLENGVSFHEAFFTYVNAASINWGFGELSKSDSSEKEKIASFELSYNATDPDIAAICNIKDYTGSNSYKPFGEYDKGYNGNGQNGMTKKDIINGYSIFGPDYSNLHPWFNLGYTFAFGRVYENDFSTAKKGVFPFNKADVNSEYLIQEYTDKKIRGWMASRGTFSRENDLPIMKNIISDEIDKSEYYVHAYTYLINGTTKYNAETYDDKIDDNNFLVSRDRAINISESLNLEDKPAIEMKAYYFIRKYIVGLTEDGLFVLKIPKSITGQDETPIYVNNLSFVFKRYQFDAGSPIETGTNDSTHYNYEYDVKLKTTTYLMNLSFSLNKSVYQSTIENSNTYKQENTLMPLSTYKFYAHLINFDGSITNGKLIKINGNDEVITPAISTNNDILQLKVQLDLNSSTNNLEENYAGYFISCENVGDKIAEGFDCINNGTYNIVNCLEVDTLLYNITDNIIILDESGNEIETDAHYASSSVSNPIEGFGNCGFIYWDGKTSYAGKKVYIKIKNNSSNQEANTLYKCTPYLSFIDDINRTIASNEGFYNSFKCFVKKPSYTLSLNTYVSGSDVYAITRDTTLKLSDFSDYVQMILTTTHVIRSNFNLNYLTLTSDINDTLFSIGNAGSGVNQVAKVINSQTLSYIYELPSMYRDFQVGTYRETDDTTKTQFDNTIRVSDVLGEDSSNNSVFRFYATSFYNIPTNRGVIIKLLAIANTIYVHTQSSLYKFAGTQTITANDNEVALEEAEPFSAGAQQVIDSEFGYGGICAKHSSAATYDSYYFYDRLGNRVYAFKGNEGLQAIDSFIRSVLDEFNPNDCIVLSDEPNNRVFFQFIDDEGYVTLSFNYVTNTWVSFHTLKLNNLINTRNHVYYIGSYFEELFTEGDSYGLAEGRFPDDNFAIPFTTRSGIAVLIKQDDESNYSLDSIKYAANEYTTKLIQNYLFNSETGDVNNIKLIKVFTDLTESNDIVCIADKTGNNHDEGTGSIVKNPIHNQLTNYTHPVYNGGYWFVNYFRNIINTGDLYNYKTPNKAYDITGRLIHSDNKSLIYGNWFVIRFDFRDDQIVEFRTIDINLSKYGTI